MGTPTINSVLGQYLAERRSRHELCAASRANSRYTLRDLSEFLGDPPLDRIRRRDIERWMASRPLAATTLRIRFCRARAFFRWCVVAGLIPAEPTNGVSPPRQPRTLPRQLRDEQVCSIIAAAPDERVTLIVLLMWRLGLRACEVARMRWEDVDLGALVLTVHGKGGHHRLLPIVAEVVDALDAYTAAVGATRRGFVIRSFQRPHAGISAQYVSDLVVRTFNDAGVHRPRDGRTGHALRHTRAGRMVRRGAHIRTVQTFLGHSQLSSTQIYLPIADVEHIRPWLEDDPPSAA